VIGFSHTSAFFTLPAAYSIRFFAYICLLYVAGGTFYSIFRIHLPSLRYRRHTLFDFSNTSAFFTLLVAHSIRFFAYICFLYVTGGTLYSIFRIHAFFVTFGTFYSIFRIHLPSLRYRWHIVFGFSHTSAFFRLLVAHCIRFFAYIWLIQLTGSTFYSIFRIHLAHSAYQ
jgi:hypothetical protein